MKKLSVLFVLAFMLIACGNNSLSSKYEHKFTDRNGAEQKVYVDLALENGKISKISIDETYTQDGISTTKKALGDDYGMNEVTTVGEWDDQIIHLEKTLVGTDGKIALDDKGYPTESDVTSGCTINLTEIQKAILDAVKNAK